MNEERQGSSAVRAAAEDKPQVPGSSPGPGSGTWQYIVVREELRGGALLAQVAHAAGESVIAGPLPGDTRVAVLMATKQQLIAVRTALDNEGVAYTAILETDGVLEGSITAIGLVTTDREKLAPILGKLKTWREPRSMKIPGKQLTAAVITPSCKAGRGVGGAFDEAARRLRATYDSVATKGATAGASFHLGLTIDQPGEER